MQKQADFIYPPQIVSTLTTQMLKELSEGNKAGLRMGIPDVDRVLIPIRPGKLVVVMGPVSHYKSGVMNWFTRQALAGIEPESDDIVVKVTWEQSVEEDTLSWLSCNSQISITKLAQGAINKDEWLILNRSSVERSKSPLWIMGHSVMNMLRRPRMTMTDVANGIYQIANGEITGSRKRIRLVVLDYLQRIRPDPGDGDDRRIQVSEAVDRAKDCSIAFGTPVMLGCQTGRHVLNRDDKLPMIGDAQETSNVEQSADVVLATWYPIKTEGEGAKVKGWRVTKNLLVFGILKQKLGSAPHRFMLYIEPEVNNMAGMAKEEEPAGYFPEN